MRFLLVFAVAQSLVAIGTGSTFSGVVEGSLFNNSSPARTQRITVSGEREQLRAWIPVASAIALIENEEDDHRSAVYTLVVVILLVGFISVMVFRIRTQRIVNLQLQKSIEAARLARESAEHAEKLRRQFISNVSHEIKTPMAGLVGMASILDELITDPVQRKYLDTIRVCSRNLLIMVNDLLDLGRMETDSLELRMNCFNLWTTFTYCEEVARMAADDKGIGLEFKIDPSVPEEAVGDSTRLQQIFVNILNNAVKFTDKGSVKLEAVYKSGFAGVGVLEVTISDTGVGIEPERLNTVFEPFNTTHEASGNGADGSGLGLAISKKLVDLMRGSIKVTSKQGEGSVFVIRLPMSVPSADDE